MGRIPQVDRTQVAGFVTWGSCYNSEDRKTALLAELHLYEEASHISNSTIVKAEAAYVV